MKLLTRDTDYAIRAITYIACAKQKVTPVAELVRILKIPRPFLRKILQKLNQARLLKSYKGQGGGFLLAVPARKISLMRLINIFQGPFRLNECFFKKEICPNIAKCGLKQRIDRIERHLMKELSAINMGCLLERKH